MMSSALLLSCSDDPNPVGGSLLPDSDLPVIKVDTFYASSHSISRTLLNTQASDRAMIGKYQAYESWGMVKFMLPESLQNVSVTDAKVLLKTNYHFGDSLAPLSFDTYKALKDWQGDSLSLDSLTQGNFYDNTRVLGQFSMAVGDTDDISFPLDTVTVREWCANLPDTALVNQGIVFRPTNMDVIKGFRSYSNANPEALRPRLIIQYVKNGSADTVTVNVGLTRFVANIENSSLVQNSESIYIQAGVAYNGFMSFITTSPIPAKASIHKAELELSLDASASKLNSFTIDSLFAFYVTPQGIDITIQSLSQPQTNAGQKVYRFPIQHFVQRWVRGQSASVAVFTFTEVDVLDLFVFYGENSPNALRPKVIVTYSPTR